MADFETVRLKIGTERWTNGRHQDFTHEVEFKARRLGEFTKLLGDRDLEGVTQTLFETPSGELVVYVEDWSRWQGVPNKYYLRKVTRKDLLPGGEFEFLGREAGLSRPLTLDEALDFGA